MDRIKTLFWNYIDFRDYKPEMLDDWAKCGMTHPVSPRMDTNVDDCDAFLKMLDDAHARGLKIIVQATDITIDKYLRGADEYRAACERVHGLFGRHPAVCGYYAGDEPDIFNEKLYFESVKILKSIIGDKIAFCNMGSVERSERMLLKKKGQTLTEWVKEFVDYSGADVLGYGSYSPLLPGSIGVDEHFALTREFSKATKAAGIEMWASTISSCHYNFRVPTELDFQWQLTTSVALGAKAIVWFRFYDKIFLPEYYGSPVDEFGEKTQHYYNLARVQKRFNVHFGEIMARLNFLDAYGVGISFGGYHYFTPESSDLVERVFCPHGLISFFKDDDGNDYAVVVNTSQTEVCTCTLAFKESVKEAGLLRFNGTEYRKECDRGDKNGLILTGDLWLHPGQMELIKIIRS